MCSQGVPVRVGGWDKVMSMGREVWRGRSGQSTSDGHGEVRGQGRWSAGNEARVLDLEEWRAR